MQGVLTEDRALNGFMRCVVGYIRLFPCGVLSGLTDPWFRNIPRDMRRTPEGSNEDGSASHKVGAWISDEWCWDPRYSTLLGGSEDLVSR